MQQKILALETESCRWKGKPRKTGTRLLARMPACVPKWMPLIDANGDIGLIVQTQIIENGWKMCYCSVADVIVLLLLMLMLLSNHWLQNIDCKDGIYIYIFDYYLCIGYETITQSS